MWLQLLGGAGAQDQEGWISFLPERPYQLLVYLAYHADWVGRDKLAFLFWPDHPEADARRNLRKIILRAKEFNWAHNLEVGSKQLRWAIPTDVAEFQQAIQQQRWAEAMTHYRGPLLLGMDDGASQEFSNWVALEGERLHSWWRETLLANARDLEAKGKPQAAAAALRPLLEPGELDEEALKLSMLALNLAGRGDAALWVYQEFAQRLKEQLELEPSSAIQSLAHSIESGTPATPRAKPTAQILQQAAAIPTPTTAFVGRELELSELGKLLVQPECRLLTLIGPGGVGKTRIVLKATEALLHNYSGGAFFVPLEALSSPAQIATKIAEVLNLNLSGQGEPLAQIVQHLAAKQVLLVLDNFEHLLAGATQLAELLQRCPDVQILVTSRERLALEGEWLLPLEGLSYPQHKVLLQEALGFDAVNLFVSRARQLKQGFALTESDLHHVLEVCRITQGFPLALELAAAWVRLLSCAEIAQEIKQNLDFLVSHNRDLPVRQQSLRATFEYSWNLLNPLEQEALQKLSIFRGGFTREAAHFVADVRLPVLATLMDKSLLRSASSGRYDSHSLLYQFTQEKGTEQRQLLEQRHQNFFFASLKHHAAAFRGAGQKQALDAVQDDLENIGLAVHHALKRRHALELGAALAHLTYFYQIRGLWREGLEAWARVWEVFDPDLPSHRPSMARVLFNQAMLHSLLGEVAAALEKAQQSLGLYRQTKNMDEAIGVLNILGILYDDKGEYPQARHYFQQALRLAQKNHNHERELALLSNLALVEFELGNYQQAYRKNQELLQAYRQRQDLNGLSITLSNQGHVLVAMGDYASAKQTLQESLEVAGNAGIEYVIPETLIRLGIVELMHQGYDQANGLLGRALSASREVSALRREVESLDWLGYVALRLGHFETAQQTLFQALKLAHGAGFRPGLLQALTHYGELLMEQGNQSEALRLMSLVLEHPATSAINRDAARHLLRQWKLRPVRDVPGLEVVVGEIGQ